LAVFAAQVLAAPGLALKSSGFEFAENARSFRKGQVVYPADYA
jgi:hypothetical protein